MKKCVFPKLAILFLSFSFSLGGCAKSIVGPQGEQGIQGEAGPQGPAGNNGENGLTPFIGDNGNWWIGTEDTGVKAAYGYYFQGNTVEELNLVLKKNYNVVFLDPNLELNVNETIYIQKNQKLIGNGALLCRSDSFFGKMVYCFEGVSVTNLLIDGGNVIDGTWDTTIELSTLSNCYIANCSFNNCNETIVVYGQNVVVETCTINYSNGNGIHLSACTKSIIRNNMITNTNLSDSYTNGTSGIYICDDVYDCVIDGNVIDGCINGIGKLNTINNQRIQIINNSISNCSEYGISGIYHSEQDDWSSKDIIISNNILTDCSCVRFKNNYDPSIQSDMRLVFSNNILINTKLDLESNRNAIVTDNHFVQCGIELNYADGCLISQNSVTGFSYGILGQRSRNIMATNNTIKATTYGICFSTDSSNNTVSHNQIWIYDTDIQYGYGIYGGPCTNILSNIVHMNYGVGIIAYNYQIIELNKVIFSYDDGVAIKVYGGTTNLFVLNNITNEKGCFELSSGINCIYDNNVVWEGLV